MRRKNKNNYNKQLHVHEKFVIIIFIFLCPARHRTAIRMTWRRCWVSQCFFFLFFFLNFFFRRGIYFTSWLFAFYSLVIYKLEAPVIEIEMWKWLSDCCLLLFRAICRSFKLCTIRTFFNRFCWCCSTHLKTSTSEFCHFSSITND